MKYLFLLLFVFGIFGEVLGQDDCLKSQKELINGIDKFNSDYEKAIFLDKICSENSTCHYLTTLIFDEADRIIRTTKEEKAIIWSNFIIAGYYRTHGEKDKALKLYEKIIVNPLTKKENIYYQAVLRRNSILIRKDNNKEMYTTFQDKELNKFINSNKKYQLSFLSDLAETKFANNEIDSVHIYLNKINNLSEDNKIYKATYYSLAYSFYDRWDMYDSMLITLQKEELLRIELKDSLFLSNVYSSLGRVYYHVDNMEKAYIYHNKALEIRKKFNLKNIASTYNSIGKVLIVQLKYAEAFPFLEKSLEEYEKIGDLYNVAYVKDLFAYLKAGLKYKNGERGNYEEEIKMAKEAFEYQQKEGTSFDIVASGNNLCMVYLLADKPKEAQKIMVEIKKYEQEMPIEEKINIVLADIQTKMALRGVEMRDVMEIDGIGDDLAKLLELQDSVAFQKYDKEIPRITAEAETQRVLQEKKEQELTNQITQKELEASNTRNIATGIIAFVLFLGGLVVSILFIKNRNKKILLEEQKEEIETQNQELVANNEEIQSQKEVIERANEDIKILKGSLEHDLDNDIQIIHEAGKTSVQDLLNLDKLNRFENLQSSLLAIADYYSFMNALSRSEENLDVRELLYTMSRNILKKYNFEKIIDIKTTSNLNARNENERTAIRKTVVCIAELIRNTLKHAFPPAFLATLSEKPVIHIDLFKKENSVFIIYSDNGKGLDKDLQKSELGNGLGLKILKDSSYEEGFVWKNKEEGGILVQLNMKIDLEKKSDKYHS